MTAPGIRIEIDEVTSYIDLWISPSLWAPAPEALYIINNMFNVLSATSGSPYHHMLLYAGDPPSAFAIQILIDQALEKANAQSPSNLA